jgi:8-oxo-dGTP pyrophosphatase MutT (NUDIX family)
VQEQAAQAEPVVKHATASVFVLCQFPGGWRLGLVEHPRFARLMMPGGHVEAAESQAEAAVREVGEEAGLPVRLVGPPAPPLPPGYRPPRVAQPWWIVEYHVPPDGHLAAAHVHVDHLYVAVADQPRPVSEPGHPFGWYSASDLPGLTMFDDARILAAAVLASLDGGTDGTGPASTPAGARAAGRRAAAGCFPGGGPDAGLGAAIAARLGQPG